WSIVLRIQQRSGRAFLLWRRPQARPDRSDPFPDLGCVERRGTGFDRNQVPRAWRDRHLHRARPAQFLVSPAADRSTWRVNCKVAGQKDQAMAIFHWISTFTGKIMRAWAGRYRPERHYMRGTGPASKR